MLATGRAPICLLVVDPPPIIKSDHLAPRPHVSHVTPAILNDPVTRIVDESLQAYFTILPNRTAIDLFDAETTQGSTIYTSSSFLINIACNGDYMTALFHVLLHHSHPAKEDEDINTLLGRAFYRLCCLGRIKFGFDGPLPAHIEAVRIVTECLKGFTAGSAT